MTLEPGGRPGGEMKFLIGIVLAGIGIYLFFHSVQFTSGHHGLISGALGRGRGGAGGMGQTTSMGIIFVPLFIGVLTLFFDVRKKWGWGLTIFGLLVLAIEILSRIRPHFNVNAMHAIMMLVLIAGGFGLMLRGYIEDRRQNGGE